MNLSRRNVVRGIGAATVIAVLPWAKARAMARANIPFSNVWRAERRTHETLIKLARGESVKLADFFDGVMLEAEA